VASDGIRLTGPGRDASAAPLHDASRSSPSHAPRCCGWCRGAIAVTARRDARYCGQSCRQAAHRFASACVARERASRPLRFAYADPPYPGLARRYYAEHEDYGGEVDHAELLSQLATFDGWALSTNARSLPAILAVCVARALDVRVGAWFRGARRGRAAWPLSTWEPVVFAGGRRLPSLDVAEDALICHARPRRTDPGRVVGAKPARFCFWIFDLLGARPGDELADLFPGSGGIRRAWQLYESRSSTGHASRVDDGHASRRSPSHASPGAGATRRVAEAS
jgi:hypothetical protein